MYFAVGKSNCAQGSHKFTATINLYGADDEGSGGDEGDEEAGGGGGGGL